MFLLKIRLFIIYNKKSFISFALFFVLLSSLIVAPYTHTALGAPNSRVEGIDNTYLIAVNLDKFTANYKIENIEADEEFYYVLYTFNDLVLENGVWQEMSIEKTRKISIKGLEGDLGLYLASQLAEENTGRINELRSLQDQAKISGPERRIKVTEYSGLIGKALSVAGDFSGYEPVKKSELPSPVIIAKDENQVTATTPSDNIKSIYDDFVASHQELGLGNQQVATDSIILVPAGNVSTSTEASSTIVNF